MGKVLQTLIGYALGIGHLYDVLLKHKESDN